MLVQTVELWEPSSLADFLKDKELFEIAMEIYKDEFKDFCDDLEKDEKKKLATQKGTHELFETFIEEVAMVSDESECFEAILDAWAVKHNHKATFCDWTRGEYDEYYRIHLMQVVPTSKEDLVGLAEVYLKQNSSEEGLAEIVTDKILNSF